MDNKKLIKIHLLNPEWTKRAHPMLMILKGGHRAKAGEWFLEVQRVLYDIYKTFVALENFMNRGHKDLYVGEKKDKIEISEIDRLWALGYMVENAYLRIGSCLDKIAQMTRVYYEHPDHGEPLFILPRCGKCSQIKLTEEICSFGTLVGSLRRQSRISEVDNALFALEKSRLLQKIKKARNDISHRINKTIFNQALDPNINLEINGKIQKTTFTFGRKYYTPEEYRKMIADAHNEIVDQLNIIGPKIFPPEKGKQNHS